MMDLKTFDAEELKNLIREINKELENRKREEYIKDYKNALSALEVMAKKYPWDEFVFYDGVVSYWEDIYKEVKRNFEW